MKTLNGICPHCGKVQPLAAEDEAEAIVANSTPLHCVNCHEHFYIVFDPINGLSTSKSPRTIEAVVRDIPALDVLSDFLDKLNEGSNRGVSFSPGKIYAATRDNSGKITGLDLIGDVGKMNMDIRIGGGLKQPVDPRVERAAAEFNMQHFLRERDGAKKEESLRKRVPQILRDGAATYEQRNALYGDSYKQFGPLMHSLFPEGLTLDNPEDWMRYGVLNMIMSKITRYASNFNTGGHYDSAHDLMVYAAMLSELTVMDDEEEGDDNGCD